MMKKSIRVFYSLLTLAGFVLSMTAADAAELSRTRKKVKEVKVEVVADTVAVDTVLALPAKTGAVALSVLPAVLPEVEPVRDTVFMEPEEVEVIPGIEVLERRGFKGLVGKRVGLVTNPTGVDRRLRSTIDILYHAPGVELVALYGPEHGVRGDMYAGDHVKDFKDPATGLPVFSIYGATRKPTQEMLKGVDIMVYDIQDTGIRSYTFISSLGLVMEACAEAGIEVMVLDRPNPLGGLKMEGAFVQDGFHSFVSQYKIPYVYGLTVGELAQLINEEGLNRGQLGKQAPAHCKLTVVPMEGWKREMYYEETKLPWVLPSPNIPHSSSPACCASAGVCGELYGFLNIGIGYTLPFEVFGATWMDADKLKAELDSYELPGVEFRVIHYKPFAGSARGQMVHGVQYFYTDFEAAEITLTQF